MVHKSMWVIFTSDQAHYLSLNLISAAVLSVPKAFEQRQTPDALCVCVYTTEYCMKHWKEDWFFGYQCLNGSNPRMIQRCKKLPENLPVTADMVQRSMAGRTNLNKELKVEKKHYFGFYNKIKGTAQM